MGWPRGIVVYILHFLRCLWEYHFLPQLEPTLVGMVPVLSLKPKSEHVEQAYSLVMDQQLLDLYLSRGKQPVPNSKQCSADSRHGKQQYKWWCEKISPKRHWCSITCQCTYSERQQPFERLTGEYC